MANLSYHRNNLLHQNLSFTNSTDFPLDGYCFFHGQNFVIFTTFTTTYILLIVPLCILILYQGLKKWRQNTSFSSASVSHSDCFTYHCVTMFFHILTCLERFVAVVHPITYLSLKTERGIRIRNATIACVWLLCLVWTCLTRITNRMLIWDLCFMILALTVVSFCSISILCVLIRSGPGGKGEDRKTVDQSKQRAVFTIVSILGVLLLRVVSNLVWELMEISTRATECVIVTSVFWFNLPSCLVLPALFLHKERRRAQDFQ